MSIKGKSIFKPSIIAFCLAIANLTMSPVAFAEGIDLLGFLAPPLHPRYKEIANTFYSELNSNNKEWKIQGIYPIEFRESVLFTFVPKDQDQDNWEEHLIFEDIMTKVPSYSFEKVWNEEQARSRKLYNGITGEQIVLGTTLKMLSQTDSELIFEKFRKSTNRKEQGHYIVRIVKFDDNRFWRFEYQRRYVVLEDQEREDIMQKIKTIENKLLS